MLIETAAELQTAPYIRYTPRDEVRHFVSISECEDRDFCEKRENCALIGMLLQVRHNSFATDEKKTLLTTGSRYAPGANTISRQRLGGGNKNYDRLALFADTRENGRCFAIIFKNSSVSTNFFRRCIRTHEGVGNVFYLDEPAPVTSTLGSTSSVPIIESVWDTVPICNPICTIVPAVPLQPPDMGCTRYFSSHNVTDIKFYNATFIESICTGNFCDRQLCSDNFTNPTNARCGCFHYDRSSSAITIQFDIQLSCPFEFDQSGKTYVSNFRSYRTALLFIKKETLKLVKTNDSEHLKLLRKAVANIVDYININGGWSYVGWLRTGIVHDISETQATIAENLASTSQTPHLSYLYPTNISCISEQINDYNRQKMKINTLNDNITNSEAQNVVEII